MKTMRHVQTWLLITLLALSASNDVWGKRLETNWNGNEVRESQTQGNQRGYTDHEHLDSIGLIHMNGRVYEAAEVARGIATGEITGQEAVTGAVITAGLNLVGGAAFKTVNKVTPPVVKEQIKDVVDKALRKNTDAQQNLSDNGTPLKKEQGGGGNNTVVASDVSSDATKGIPFGFRNAGEFGQFGKTLNSGLADAGLGGTKAILQGSAVTGKSFRTGKAFDAGRVSDFDIALAGPDILARARQLGIGLRSGGTRTGPLTGAQIQQLGLGPLRNSLSQSAGRPVNFMVFGDAGAAAARAPSVGF